MHPIASHILDLEQQQKLLFAFAQASENIEETMSVMQHILILKAELNHYKSLEPKYYEFQNFETNIETINSKINKWQSN